LGAEGVGCPGSRPSTLLSKSPEFFSLGVKTDTFGGIGVSEVLELWLIEDLRDYILASEMFFLILLEHRWSCQM